MNTGDFTSFSPLRGFHVKLCPALGAFDAQGDSGPDLCSALEDVVSDQDGNVEMDLSKLAGIREMAPLDCYFEVTAPSDLDYPKHLFFLPGWALTHSLHKNFYVSPRGSVVSLPPSAPGHGGVLFVAHDCSQVLHAADGVEVTADPAGIGPIYGGPQPDRSATFTSSTGIGAISDLPAGQVKLSSKRHDTGEPIGTTLIVIEADATTIVDLVPMPLADP
jgi:hypothetical protein